MIYKYLLNMIIIVYNKLAMINKVFATLYLLQVIFSMLIYINFTKLNALIK